MSGVASDWHTPPGGGGAIATLLRARRLGWVAARIGIALARLWNKPLRLGQTVIVARHAQVQEVLRRDVDFLVAPVNAARFEAIGYPFILGKDRALPLVDERASLYQALARVDMAPLRQALAAGIEAKLPRAGHSVDIVGDYARPLAGATARALFGIAPADEPAFLDAARAIFAHCFLNLAGDKAVEARAMAAAAQLTAWFDAEIACRRAGGVLGEDLMGRLLQAGASDDLTRRSLGGMLVGSIDTTATVVAKVMAVLLADRALLARAAADTDDLDRLAGWCDEALRRWCHVPLLGRQAAGETELGGTQVPAAARLILWTQAAMCDPDAFPDPATLRPDRPSGAYLHLGGGLHPCAGRAINRWQIAMLVGGLLARRPQRLEPIAWAGPFPAHARLSLGGL